VIVNDRTFFGRARLASPEPQRAAWSVYCFDGDVRGLGAVLLIADTAHAVTAADKCEAAKLKVAGKYDFCRLKAEAAAVKTDASPAAVGPQRVFLQSTESALGRAGESAQEPFGVP
jgi:hypothetical protein